MKEKICDRIVNDLLMEINKGLLKPKEKLPTNQELAKKYNASVVTVRKSIGILINKGYLTSIERVGIFVKERKKDLFYINFAVEGNINEEITKTVIEDIHMSITWDKESHKDIKTLEIKTIYYSESMPIGYSIDALFLRGHYNTDDITEKTEKKIMQMMTIFNGFDVKKSLKITMDYPNRYIAQRLLIDESIPMFCFIVNVKTLENQPIGKRTFYIATENVELRGKSFYD